VTKPLDLPEPRDGMPTGGVRDCGHSARGGRPPSADVCQQPARNCTDRIFRIDAPIGRAAAKQWECSRDDVKSESGLGVSEAIAIRVLSTASFGAKSRDADATKNRSRIEMPATLTQATQRSSSTPWSQGTIWFQPAGTRDAFPSRRHDPAQRLSNRALAGKLAGFAVRARCFVHGVVRGLTLGLSSAHVHCVEERPGRMR
jgi:hypothetical protein